MFYSVESQPDMFSNSYWDQFTLEFLSWLQKYGVLITMMVVLMCLVFRYMAKIRKNTKLQQMWLMLAIGMGTLCVMLIFLPYVALHYLQ